MKKTDFPGSLQCLNLKKINVVLYPKVIHVSTESSKRADFSVINLAKIKSLTCERDENRKLMYLAVLGVVTSFVLLATALGESQRTFEKLIYFGVGGLIASLLLALFWWGSRSIRIKVDGTPVVLMKGVRVNYQEMKNFFNKVKKLMSDDFKVNCDVDLEK